jgi:hypothetical protein
MRRLRLIATTGTISMLAACGLVSPVLNPSMSNAPLAACGTETAEAQDGPQCFTFERIGPGELRAVLRSAPECAGDFRHATVEGSSAGPGSLDLAVSSATAAGLPRRQWRWSQGFERRSFPLRDVGTTFLIPGAAVIRSDGDFTFRRLCFRGY